PLYRGGADPLALTQDLLEVVHLTTRLKLAPKAEAAMQLSEVERVNGGRLADALSIPSLSRAWQILLKGIGEVQMAPTPLEALEMRLVRLAHAAELPNPADLVRQIQSGAVPASAPAPARAPEPGGGVRMEAVAGGGARLSPAPAAARPQTVPTASADPQSFAE